LEGDEAMTDAPAPLPKRQALVIVGQFLLALGATFGSLFLLAEFGYEPAWPLLVGIGLFVVIVWWIAIRGARRAARPAAALGVVGFALVVIGAINLQRAEEALRVGLQKAEHERLGVPPGEHFRDDDAFGQECEKVFGRNASSEPLWADRQREWKMPNPDGYPAMAKLIEERKPGWPRVLQMFARAGVVESLPVRSDHRSNAYGGRVQVGCGHHFATMLGLTRYGALSAYARSEKRLMELAEADREIFLKGWKALPKDQQ
jgi:hypothetical protein